MNSYAEELFYEDDRLQARRDQPKFLNLCKAVAFLNQMKKTRKTTMALTTSKSQERKSNR